MKERRARILAIASGGGHWVQLLRLRPAFEGFDVLFVTVAVSYRDDVPGARFAAVPDATRWSPFRMAWLALRIFWILLRERPQAIVTTGAAPGYLALRLGKLIGARTIWIDSIANTDEVSMSGRKARRVADLWLTQWEHLETPSGPAFRGSVL